MKSVLFIILLMLSFKGRSQVDSVTYFFGKILNQYRIENNLDPLTVDEKLSDFSNSHVKYMAENDILTHNDLAERIDKFFPNQTINF